MTVRKFLRVSSFILPMVTSFMIRSSSWKPSQFGMNRIKTHLCLVNFSSSSKVETAKHVQRCNLATFSISNQNNYEENLHSVSEDILQSPSDSATANPTRNIHSTNDLIPSSPSKVDQIWKSIPKPLLRIGGNGIALSHGNSLRELLLAHKVVKVKVNTSKFGSLEQVFLLLKDMAEQAGANPGMELLQYRKSENTLLIGLAGTLHPTVP